MSLGPNVETYFLFEPNTSSIGSPNTISNYIQFNRLVYGVGWAIKGMLPLVLLRGLHYYHLAKTHNTNTMYIFIASLNPHVDCVPSYAEYSITVAMCFPHQA
jgi:hypothetical protein